MKSIDRLRLGTDYYRHKVKKKTHSVMWHERWLLFDQVEYDKMTVIERTDQAPVARFLQGIYAGELKHMDKSNRSQKYKRLRRFFRK
jgi:hypothetical protein